MLVHISDLHLHPPLTEQGRILLRRFGARTHVYYCLVAALEAVSRIILNVYPRSVIVAVTGDLTTVGDPVAFELAREILEETVITWSGEEFEIGLGLVTPACVVPGNHDRLRGNLLRVGNRLFEASFGAYLPMNNWYNYGLDPQNAGVRKLPYVRVIPPSADTVVVIVGLDSTELYRLEQLVPVWGTARGRVSQDSLTYLRNVCNDIDENGTVVDSDGVRHNLSGSVVRKVVLLHHHPHLPPDQRWQFLTKLRNARRVVKTCASAGIHLVLYGHEHIAFADTTMVQAHTRRRRHMVCAAAGSACVYSERRGNSFSVYYFDRGSIGHEIWQSDGYRFRRQGYMHSLPVSD